MGPRTLFKKISATSLVLTLCAAAAHAASGDLCRAASARPLDAEKVKAAVLAGEDVNTPCPGGSSVVTSPLALVIGRTASNGPAGTEAARFLIEKGASPDFVNEWKTGGEYRVKRSRSNLAEVASFADSEVLRAFLAKKPNLEFRTSSTKTPLGEAISWQKWQNARLLISAGANRYALSTDKIHSGEQVVDTTALSLALALGAPLDFKRELLSGWDFLQDPLNISRVYLSYELQSPNRSLAFVRELIALGANPRAVCMGMSGWNPGASCESDALMLVADHRRYAYDPAEGAELIRYLVSLGLDVNGKNGETLNAAVGNAEWVGLTLLELGAKADYYYPGNPADGGGETILTGAAYLGRTALVRALVEHGAVINDRRPRLPPLTAAVDQYAATRNCLDTIQELVRLGADVNLPDHYGRTALCLAVHSGDSNPVGREDPVVALLLDHGAVLGNCRQ